MRYLIPALALALLVALFAVGLHRDPHIVPSPLIGKPVPAFALPPLAGGVPLTDAAFKGHVTLVNYWASWCTECINEHALLLEKAGAGVPVVGIAWKDTQADAQQWLSRHGNPYTQVLLDADGHVGIDWGVYGVPETYVVDAAGVIRFKQIGPITREVWEHDIAPLLGKTS